MSRFTPDAVSVKDEALVRSWTSDDAILYALGVGAGRGELALTTENTANVAQVVLPSFAVVLGTISGLTFDTDVVDLRMIVHGMQDYVVHRPLPPSGTVSVRSELEGVYDKGKSALIVVKTTGREQTTDDILFVNTAGIFLRGAGGWGGARGGGDPIALPARKPDARVTLQTSADQALIYRLSGDKNPLHSDPALAKSVGFREPILHGLCTYGVACRALAKHFCPDAPGRLSSMSGRFPAPVYPGQALTTEIWSEGDEIVHRTLAGDETVVIDSGSARLAPG